MIQHPVRRGLTCAMLLLGLATTVHAGEALPPDLALVPGNALGFVHVRVADIWRSPQLKIWRETILEAGKPALKAFDNRFTPSPSSIDRLTVVVLPPGGSQREPQVFAILRTSQPINREKFFKYTFPDSKEDRVNDKVIHFEVLKKVAVAFLDDETLVVGPMPALRMALEKAPEKSGMLSDALALANSGKALVGAMNVAAIARFGREKIPPDFQALARAQLATLSIDLGSREQITARLVYASPEAAQAAELEAKAGLRKARLMLMKTEMEMRKKVLGQGQPGTLDELPDAAGALMVLGGLKRLEKFLMRPPLKLDGSALQVALEIPHGGGPEMLTAAAMGAGLLVPAVQKVREAAARTQDMNNLKQIALAMHIYHDANRTFPPAALCDAAGKPLLSWRVAILPYLEQNDLYKMFKLDEPWDSPSNKKLIPLMPKIYQVPIAPTTAGQTHYQVFVGNGAAFDLKQGVPITSFTDGTSNTILVVETADSVPWTKPGDIPYDPKTPLPRFLSANGRFAAAFADGSVHSISMDLTQEVLRALITRNGGEAVPPGDW